MFTGSITALVTPFRDGAVDEKALQSLVEWQIAEGTHGLVPCGTTGESPTLSHEEHHRVVELVIEAAAGRVPVIAGTGSNSTDEAIELSQHAEKAGADALLVVSPYYNRPSQEGIYQHYRHLDARVGIPIIVYNIPPRSAVDISVETMARIYRDCRNVVGVKDATANLARPSLERMACGNAFNLISGEDGTALGYMAHGGHGCISVTANVAPRLCAEFQTACLAGDFRTALALQDRLMPLHRAMFLEPNPAGPKWGLHRLGRIDAGVRLPLVPLTPAAQSEMEAAMVHAGVIDGEAGSGGLTVEVFVSDREPDKAVTLTARLKALGLRGRDAAYLASAAVPAPEDRNAVDHYLAEFRYMVAEDRRPEAARLIGLSEY